MATDIGQIQRPYIAYGHPAHADGQANLGKILATDSSAIPTSAATFAQSAEHAANFSGKSSAAIVMSPYQNRFGHAPGSAQLANWAGRLDQGGNIGTVMTGIIGGAAAADVSGTRPEGPRRDRFHCSARHLRRRHRLRDQRRPPPRKNLSRTCTTPCR